MGVLDGVEDAPGSLLAALAEAGVQAGDDKVEFGQHLIGEVERAVGANLHLRAVEHAEVGAERGVGRPHLGRLLPQPFDRQAVGHAQADRVVGDGHRPQAAVARGAGHLQHAQRAVGPGRVHVQVVADVVERYQRRQLAGQGGLDLAAVFAQAGGNEGQAQPGVDLLFGGAENLVAAVERGEGVLVEAQPLLQGHLAQLDVVVFAAGEVVEQRAPARGGQHAQVDAQPVEQHDVGLGRAAPGNGFDVLQGGEAIHHFPGRLGGHQQVDVADGLAHPAQRAADGRRRDARHALQLIQHRLGDGPGHAQRHTRVAVAGQGGDAGQNLGLRLGPHARQIAQLAFAGGGGQFVQRRDLERFVDLLDALRPQPFDAQHVYQPRRNLQGQLIVEGQPAGGQHLLDLGRQRVADAGDVGQLALSVDDVDVAAQRFDALGRLAIGQNAMNLVAANGQHIGHATEQVDHLAVFHSDHYNANRRNRLKPLRRW